MAQYTKTYYDPDAEEIGIKRIGATTGEDADPADNGQLQLKLSDTLGSDGDYHKVKHTKAVVCVQGNMMEAIVAMSDPYDPDP